MDKTNSPIQITIIIDQQRTVLNLLTSVLEGELFNKFKDYKLLKVLVNLLVFSFYNLYI